MDKYKCTFCNEIGNPHAHGGGTRPPAIIGGKSYHSRCVTKLMMMAISDRSKFEKFMEEVYGENWEDIINEEARLNKENYWKRQSDDPSEAFEDFLREQKGL